jgi:DNA helicase HerA-like ATPase
LIPRIGDRKLDLRFFGHSYTYCLVNCGGRLHIFLETPTHPTTLRTFFGVRERGYGDLLKLFGGVLWVADFRLKRVDDAWFSDLIISDLPGLVNSLDSPGGICVSVSRSSELAPLLIRRVAALYRKALKEGDPVLRLRASAMQKKIPKLLLGRVLALASGGGELRKLCGLVRESSTIDLRWVTRKVVDGEGLSVLLRPPRVGFWDKLLGLRGRVLLNEELIDEIVKLPDPSLHKVEFTREFPLPPVPPRRVSPRSFRIGSLEDGSEFRLDVEDLRRHAYLIGQTGSGKTSLLKLLVHRLAELGDVALVVIDPHGDMARELAEEIPESTYLHPIKSPFGINPLDLPRAEDRSHAVTIAVDILLSVFKEVLKLMETAVNVKYLLQVVLRTLYSKSDSPTMGNLHDVILALYEGELDLDVGDPEWGRQLSALRRMHDQTFISALSRLEPYARDKLLLKLTSRTTIRFDEVMNPGNVTLFAVPKSDLGESLARLVASTIVMKLWFEVLARARLGGVRTPVFLIIDEFQFVSDLPIIDTILSEARKYGLHLIVAHQHTGQLPRNLLQSVLTNCAVKVVFMLGGHDVKKLSLIDAGFAKSLSEALTSLTVGKAVVKVVARPGEQQPPPTTVLIDYVPHTPRRRDVCTNAYDPGEPRASDLKSMLNPVLKYVEVPKPLRLQALYEVYKAGEISVVDLATRLGAPRKEVEDVVGELAAQEFVVVERRGNKRVVKYVKGLFNGLEAVAPSSEGLWLAREVMLRYLSEGYYVSPARNEPGIEKPDLVAMPVDRGSWRPLYSEAVAIEIESCNELETHREQVVRNWVKSSTKDFKEVHSWAREECFEKLNTLHQQQSSSVRGRVRVFKIVGRERLNQAT